MARGERSPFAVAGLLGGEVRISAAFARSSAESIAYRHVAARAESLSYVELPKGCLASHICIRRIGKDHVEIAPGSPMMLGDFDWPVVEGEEDPAEGMFDDEGRFAPPASFRSLPVTKVDDLILYGPIQPNGEGIVIRSPWPKDVRKACETIAGRGLPVEITDAAWRGCDPDDPSMNYCGVRKAA